MKTFQVAVLLALSASPVWSEQVRTNPLSKVLDLMDTLAAKVTKEGEAEAKAYSEYMEWCDDTKKDTDFAIEIAEKQKAKLEAKIAELSSNIQVADSKIEGLGASIAQAEAELKNATLIREKEAADFGKSEQELMDVSDTLGRAIGILEKEMSKSAASLAQVDTSSTTNMLQALGAILDAAAFPSEDQKKLVAFVQSRQADEDDDMAAPAASTYESQSGGIVEVLEDMKEKAEGQLADLRKAEMSTKHNFEMLQQSLEDQVAADTKDMDDEKADKAAAEEAKAAAEGDLEMTAKDLASSKKQLATAMATCDQVSADHEATVASRAEELKAISEAKKVLEATSSGAEAQTYSFVQVDSRLRSRTDLRRSEVVALVKQLAKKHHSAALAQLASRIAAAVKLGTASGEDVFGKVKGLIADMIAKLEKEAGAEATEKAYCDEQMSKTEAKKAELEEDVAKMTAKIDTATANSAKLKEEVKELQAELAALAKAQAEMGKIRSETHADYEVAKADLEFGLDGVRKALQVLRDYYGSGSAALVQDGASVGALMQQPPMPELHTKAAGAGSSIVGILEVVESDFATNLAKEETQEEDAQAEYEKVAQENKITKTTKEQDVKYKTQEAKSLDTTISEVSSDRETANTELSAVLEYYAKVKDRCIAKPETYEERKRRREAEISGLKEALTILEDETALIQQRGGRGRRFRGAALTAR